jgi:glutamine synthetase
MMRPDSIAREVFGNEFVDHFGGTREHEVALWNAAVTNWESKFVSASKRLEISEVVS